MSASIKRYLLNMFCVLSNKIIIHLKHKPYKKDIPPIYLLFKQHSHSSGSKYFWRCLYMMFALVRMHFEVNFHILNQFGFSNKRRRWNRAKFFAPWYLLLTLQTSTHKLIYQSLSILKIDDVTLFDDSILFSLSLINIIIHAMIDWHF